MTDLTSLRDKIDSVTAEMAARAADDDWSSAAELSVLRRDLLEALFVSTGDPREEVSLMERILESDRSLKTLAEVRRSKVSDELAERRSRRQALNVYRDAASAEI